MTFEASFGELVKGLHNVNYSYSGTAYHPKIVREYESTNREENFLVIRFIPQPKRYKGNVTGNVLGPRGNTPYFDYGYPINVRCIITSMAKSDEVAHGRYLADHWLWAIIKYINTEWESILIDEMWLDRESYDPPHSLGNLFTEPQYVYQTSFDMIMMFTWNDEPDTPLGYGEVTEVEITI